MKKGSLSDVNRTRLEEYTSSCKELCKQILGPTIISYDHYRPIIKYVKGK